MNLIVKPINAKLIVLLSFTIALLLAGALLTSKHLLGNNSSGGNGRSMTNASATDPRRSPRKEYLYRLLTNTTRSLIQMEIKARRLEENMRRIKEKTADLLWKNKDKALWHILFKNISRHVAIRHEFHQHASLRRIMLDSHAHKHKMGRRKGNFK